MPSDASLLPRLENSLLVWADVPRTATVYGAVNFFMLLLWMEVPLIILAIQYGGYLALALGLAGSKLGLINTGDLDAASASFVANLREFFSLFLDMALTPIVKALAPLVVWQDVSKSLMFLFGIYVCSGVVTVLGLFESVFLAFNMLFLYGKFQEEIIKAADPHLSKAKKVVMEDVIAKIPKYEGKAKLSDISPVKGGKPSPATGGATNGGGASGKKNKSPKKEPKPAPKKEEEEQLLVEEDPIPTEDPKPAEEATNAAEPEVKSAEEGSAAEPEAN